MMSGQQRTMRGGMGPVPGIVLAAGPSTRLAGTPTKLLLPFRGAPLVTWPIRAALNSSLAGVWVVVGHGAEEVAEELAPLAGPRLKVVYNSDWPQGRSTSVRAGLDALGSEPTHVMFLLGDQPLVTSQLIDDLLRSLARKPEAPLCFPTVGGQKGNPIIYHRDLLPALRGIEGDRSGFEIVVRHWGRAATMTLPDGTSQMNVNTPEDYRALLKWERDGAPRGGGWGPERVTVR